MSGGIAYLWLPRQARARGLVDSHFECCRSFHLRSSLNDGRFQASPSSGRTPWQLPDSCPVTYGVRQVAFYFACFSWFRTAATGPRGSSSCLFAPPPFGVLSLGCPFFAFRSIRVPLFPTNPQSLSRPFFSPFPRSVTVAVVPGPSSILKLAGSEMPPSLQSLLEIDALRRALNPNPFYYFAAPL